MDDTDIFKHFLLFRGEKGLLLRLYFLNVNNYFFFLQRVCLCNYVRVAVCARAGNIHAHTWRVGSSYRLSPLSSTESRCESCSLTPLQSFVQFHPIHAPSTAALKTCHDVFLPTNIKIANFRSSPATAYGCYKQIHTIILFFTKAGYS